MALVAAVALVALAGCGSSSSSTTTATKGAVGATGASGASGATGTAGAPQVQSTGQVKFELEKPATKTDAIGAFLLKKGGEPYIAHLLATTFKLPNPLILKGVNGIGQGPFYNPKDNSITLPYGFSALVFKVLQDSHPSWNGHHLGFAAAAVNGFLLEHEFGHALIANYNLPVLGNEEDAADQIASILLLNSSAGPHLAAQAAQFFADFSGRQNPPAIADYADVHALDLQRADDILCLTAGSNRLSFQQVAQLGILPKSRLVQCPQEFNQAVNSIKQELQPHVHETLHLRGAAQG